MRGRRHVAAAMLLVACGGGPAPALDTSCPASGAGLEPLLAEIAGRGLPAPPDTARFAIGGREVLVAWKNLLSGRALTLSCTYRAHGAEWRLLRARVDEGTHLIRVSVTADPPTLVFRDADGRVLEELVVKRGE